MARPLPVQEGVEMLLFTDENGYEDREMPCQILVGVTIPANNLWNGVQAGLAAEGEHFGGIALDNWPKQGRVSADHGFRDSATWPAFPVLEPFCPASPSAERERAGDRQNMRILVDE